MNAYESVINNENLRVRVILPPAIDTAPKPDAVSTRDGSVITGYLDNPFSVDAGAEWSDRLFGLDYAKNANTLLIKLGMNIQVYTILDTSQQYIVARIPNFTFSFYVIATNSSINPMKDTMRLYEAIYPTKVNDATLKFHWGYAANALGEFGNNSLELEGKSATNGTVIVTIGKWFRAINMIIDNVVIDYSPEVAINGNPLWAKVTIKTKPRRLPYVDEFTSMFIVQN
jgi:hypothetical protein